MKVWGLLVLCAGCAINFGGDDEPPPLLTIEYVQSDCAVIPPLEEDWLGLFEGCAVRIGLSVDLAHTPADAVVSVRTPKSGSDEVLQFDANGFTEIAFVTPMLAGGWRDETYLSIGVYQGTNPRHTLDYNSLTTYIVRPAAAPSAWLWNGRWHNASRPPGDGYYDHECDDDISVRAWVGGSPAAGTYLKVSVVDVDVGGDMPLEDGIVPVDAPGRFAYAPERLCEPDRPGATGDNVDPRYDVRLYNAADTLLDTLEGGEIDL